MRLADTAHPPRRAPAPRGLGMLVACPGLLNGPEVHPVLAPRVPRGEPRRERGGALRIHAGGRGSRCPGPPRISAPGSRGGSSCRSFSPGPPRPQAGGASPGPAFVSELVNKDARRPLWGRPSGPGGRPLPATHLSATGKLAPRPPAGAVGALGTCTPRPNPGGGYQAPARGPFLCTDGARRKTAPLANEAPRCRHRPLADQWGGTRKCACLRAARWPACAGKPELGQRRARPGASLACPSQD